MQSLQSLKWVDQKCKDIVYGFIKQMEKSLKLKTIPFEIFNIFLAFYYGCEYFNKSMEGSFKISDDRLSITANEDCADDNYHTIYMNQSVESLSEEIICWTFKVNKLRGYTYFGVTNAKSKQILEDDHGMCLADPTNPTDDPNYLDGQSITFTLDLIKGELLFKVEDDPDNVVCQDVEKENDIAYVFVIQLDKKDASVTLTNFSMIQ